MIMMIMMMMIIIRSISVCCKLDLCGPSSSPSQHGGLRKLGTSEVPPLSAALSARCTLYTVLYTDTELTLDFILTPETGLC